MADKITICDIRVEPTVVVQMQSILALAHNNGWAMGGNDCTIQYRPGKLWTTQNSALSNAVFYTYVHDHCNLLVCFSANITTTSTNALYCAFLVQELRYSHISSTVKLYNITNGTTKGWLRNVVNGMYQNRIKSSYPFVICFVWVICEWGMRVRVHSNN